MPPTVAQKAQIAQFASLTGTTEKTAGAYLKRYGWKMDQAVDGYYSSNPSAQSPANDKADTNLKALFETYRDPKTDEKDVTSIDGTMRYLVEIGIDLEKEEASFLIPLEIIQAPALGEILKDNFVRGWKTAGSQKALDTVEKQKAYIREQIPLLSTDMAFFKRVYRHTFIGSKEKGQKALPLDNAITYWTMLFSPPGMIWATATTNWLDLWVEFLQKKWTKSVNKDMWNMTFEFFQKSIQDDEMSFWSEDGAWPGVIDDFVGYVKEKRGSEKMETD